MRHIVRRPVLITGLIEAVLLLVAAFGFALTAPQIAAIGAVAAIVLALVAQTQTYPAVDFEGPEWDDLDDFLEGL